MPQRQKNPHPAGVGQRPRDGYELVHNIYISSNNEMRIAQAVWLASRFLNNSKYLLNFVGNCTNGEKRMHWHHSIGSKSAAISRHDPNAFSAHSECSHAT